MIKLENFMQLKAFARQDALMLSLLWAVSFACVTIVKAGAFGNLLALATPFIIAWRLTKFRDQILDGAISFRRAFAYGVYTCFYASLIFALVQFAYFRFLDNGAFAGLITESMKILTPIYEQNGMSKADIDNSISAISMLTPIEWAFMFMMQNIFIGAVMSLPIAAVCKRAARK